MVAWESEKASYLDKEAKQASKRDLKYLGRPTHITVTGMLFICIYLEKPYDDDYGGDDDYCQKSHSLACLLACSLFFFSS